MDTCISVVRGPGRFSIIAEQRVGKEHKHTMVGIRVLLALCDHSHVSKPRCGHVGQGKILGYVTQLA